MSSINMNDYPCIYMIENQLNGHRYIGSAKVFINRIRVHLCELRKGNHHSRYLQRAFDKYGENAFRFIKLFYCKLDDLILYEQIVIDNLRPEYNISPNAQNTFGSKRTDECKKLLSNITKALWNDPEYRNKLVNAHKGYVLTKSQREKISKALIGHIVTDEMRNNSSQKQKGIAKSEEAKQKMRDAPRKKGRIQTYETRRKISETRKQRYGKNKSRGITSGIEIH